MTTNERVHTVADYGFTERQARFLVLVMRHSGLCVKRHYAAFAGIKPGGEKCNAFFDKLVRRGYAVASDCIHNRARLYHVHHKAERFMTTGAAHDCAHLAESRARRAAGHKTVWTKPLHRRVAMEIESSSMYVRAREAPRIA